MSLPDKSEKNPEPPFSMGLRETKELVEYLRAGHSVAETAKLLEMSEADVEKHIDLILQKHPGLKTALLAQRQSIISKSPSIKISEGDIIWPNPNEFTIWIDPGTSSTGDLIELFSAVSDLHKSLGGRGLIFARDSTQSPAFLAPTV